METRIHGGSALTRVAGMNGGGKVIAKRSGINQGLDRAESDGVVDDWFIG